MDDENIIKTIIHPPIYILSCVKNSSLSNIKKNNNNILQTDSSIQHHNGTMRNFIECKNKYFQKIIFLYFYFLVHFLPFLYQCSIEKYGNTSDNNHYQSEELLAGVTSYFE